MTGDGCSNGLALEQTDTEDGSMAGRTCDGYDIVDSEFQVELRTLDGGPPEHMSRLNRISICAI